MCELCNLFPEFYNDKAVKVVQLYKKSGIKLNVIEVIYKIHG